jgi:hypothetical protein
MNIEFINKTLLVTLFIFLISSMGIYLAISGDKEVSDIEYRNLAQHPDFTTSSFIEGRYKDNFENYFTDQFPGRNLWLKTYLTYQRISDKTFIYRYYVTDNGWIMPKPNYSEVNTDKTSSNLNSLANHFSKYGTDVFYFSLPHKVNTVDIKPPSHVPPPIDRERKEEFLSKLSSENLKVYDIGSIFKKKFTQSELKDMYFKTDHHWNINGALNGYKEISRILEKESKVFSKINEPLYKKTCSDDKVFEGSYNRQIYMTVDSSDEVTCNSIAADNSFEEFEIKIGSKPVNLQDVYGKGIRVDKDYITYHGLFSNDLRELNITNHKLKSKGSKVLILRDSYTNPITLHLAQHFYRTTYYDTRHNRDRDLYTYLKKNKFDAIIFLYNDTNVYGDMYDFTKQ